MINGNSSFNPAKGSRINFVVIKAVTPFLYPLLSFTFNYAQSLIFSALPFPSSSLYIIIGGEAGDGFPRKTNSSLTDPHSVHFSPRFNYDKRCLEFTILCPPPFLSRLDFLLLLLFFLSRTNCVSFTTLTLFSRDRNGTYFLVKEVLSFLLHFPSSSLSFRLYIPASPLLSSKPFARRNIYFKMSSGNVAAASYSHGNEICNGVLHSTELH